MLDRDLGLIIGYILKSPPPNRGKSTVTGYAFLNNDTVIELQFCDDLDMTFQDIIQFTDEPDAVITLSYEKGMLVGVINLMAGSILV